jgi:Mrp family chromosome partitioning ATPase
VAKRSAGKPRPAVAAPVASPLLKAIPASLIESFHYLMARLQLSDDIALPTRLAIVAATSGEGVSTVARTFAATLANDLNATVCLVDLHAPPVDDDPDAVAPRRGLINVLDNGIALKDAITYTADPRVVVLKAGDCDPAQAGNMMRSVRLPEVFDELEETYDYTIFDVPPILEGSEGLAMLRHANGYLLVIRYGVTPVDRVRAVVEELSTLASIGVVLNQCHSSIPKRLQRFFSS